MWFLAFYMGFSKPIPSKKLENTFNTAWTLKYVMRSEIHAGSHRIPEEQYIPERAENESTKPNRHHWIEYS